MARWNRRPRPDYSHLYGRPLDVILDGAIANRPYGRDRRTFPAEANEALLYMYGERDRLAVGELMDAHAALVIRTGRGADWSEAFRADVVGNLIGWGLHPASLSRPPAPTVNAGGACPTGRCSSTCTEGRPAASGGCPPRSRPP